MEIKSDLAIVLKTFPYQDRDRVVVALTRDNGKITGLAKGGVHSRRFGGSLDFLACSRIRFVKKPNAEMCRIDEAVSHHEFRNLHADFEYLTVASFAAELCLKALESDEPSNEIFTLLSNVLFHLDEKTFPLAVTVNLLLCKFFQALGFTPSLLRCVACGKAAHDLVADEESGQDLFYWTSEGGGIICRGCASERRQQALSIDVLLLFQELTTRVFKDLALQREQLAARFDKQTQNALFRVLADFLYHHVPGMPPSGLKSWNLLTQSLG